jgi:tRNA pseudouridine55 synthase
MYSAIKVNGQPLYKLARQGKEIKREGREVVVKSLKVLSFDGQDVELELVSTSGFYVRSLAHDLGQALSVGGHVVALRRLGVAGLRVENAVTLEELGALVDPAARRRKLCAVDQSLIHLPAVELSVDAAFYLCRGQAVRARNLPPKGSVRLYSSGAGFLGIGSVSGQDTVTPERLSGGEVKTG